MPDPFLGSGKTIVVISMSADAFSVLEEIFKAHEGKLHQRMGQLCVLIFPSALSAAETTVEFQRKTEKGWKAGIASGDFSEALEDATRLQSAIRLGEIAVTPSIVTALKGTSVVCTPVGTRQFAGMSEPTALHVIGRVLSRQKKVESDFDFPIDVLLDAPSPPVPKVDTENLVRIASKIAAGPSHVPTSEKLELAEEPAAVLSAKKIRLASPPPPLEPKERLGDRAKRLILLILIAVGTALVVKHGMKWLEESDSYDRSSVVKRQLEGSDVIKSMNSARRSKPKPVPTVTETATLWIQSYPVGAEVWIDHVQIKGKTPVKIGRIPAGAAVRVEIRKQGYESSLQLLNLDAGEEREISADLLRLTHPGIPAKKGP